MTLRHIGAVLIAGALALSGALAPAPANAAQENKRPSPTRAVMLVGNNWEGTADIVDARTFDRVVRLDVVPDRAERLAEIFASPDRLAYFLGIRELVGEGHDQFVDDMFTSADGRFLYVSRPSLADVVAFDLSTRKMAWRHPVEGYRADHMAISPDGRRLLVSASTARKVHVIDTATGKRVADVESGDQPHESNYSEDGTKIFHASIGAVYTPTDQPIEFFDTTKGDRWFEVIDARTFEVLERLDIGPILRTFGYPGMSSAIRPMAIAPGERYFYFQLSFFHGFVEFDLENKRPVRVVGLPIAEKTQDIPREQYLLDSAHHGLTIDPAGKKLCVAGTMSDYVAMVTRETMVPRVIAQGTKPYWSTTSANGKHCYVSFSGDDTVAVFDFETEKEVARFAVGDHPQRVRNGFVRRADFE